MKKTRSNVNRFSKESLRRNFGSVWRVHTHGFTYLLTECRKHCDGDLDQALILSAIGERALAADPARDFSEEHIHGAQYSTVRPGRTNMQSISDSTGIPRETVRRKVAQLCEKGWIERSANRSLVITEKAVAALSPVSDITVDYLLDIGNAMLADVDASKADD